MNLDPNRTGKIVSARMVTSEDEATIITANGIILRTKVTRISRQGRYSQGVRVMEMKGKKDYVASVAIIRDGAPASNDEEMAAAEGAAVEGVDTDGIGENEAGLPSTSNEEAIASVKAAELGPDDSTTSGEDDVKV